MCAHPRKAASQPCCSCTSFSVECCWLATVLQQSSSQAILTRSNRGPKAQQGCGCSQCMWLSTMPANARLLHAALGLPQGWLQSPAALLVERLSAPPCSSNTAERSCSMFLSSLFEGESHKTPIRTYRRRCQMQGLWPPVRPRVAALTACPLWCHCRALQQSAATP